MNHAEATSLRLISWNIGGRTQRYDAQLHALMERQPDLVALQEVQAGIVEDLRVGFAAMRLAHCVDTTELAANHKRKYSVLIASRWPLQELPSSAFNIPQPERLCSALVASPGGVLELHAVHVPNGASYRWKKVETFEGLYDRLARVSRHPRILCGDFNTPQTERDDGEIVTWGQDIEGRL
jgi:endonuclease/exonuclease/phosphatase family metal-dependent hydrolase